MPIRFGLGCLLLSVLLAATAMSLPPEHWTMRGIGGGGAMFAPAINPRDPTEMYVASDMSPLFHTRDGGKTWETVDFRQIQASTGSAVSFTRDPQVLWCLDYGQTEGSDTAKPVRSDDAGKTWTRPTQEAWPISRKALVLCADYDNPERALVSADAGELYLTHDGGRSYAKVLTATPQHLAGAVFEQETIYVGLGDGLYISSDGGRSFAKSTTAGLPSGFMSSFAGAKDGQGVRLYAAYLSKGRAGISGAEHANYAGLYSWRTGESAWHDCSGALPSAVTPFFVRTPANAPDVVYAAGGRRDGFDAPSVVKSVDGGKTWKEVFLARRNRNIATGWMADRGDYGWSFPEYALGFEVDRLSPDHLVLTDLGSTHVSSDGGATWRAVYTQPAGPVRKGSAYRSSGMEVTDTWQLAWSDKSQVFAGATDIRGMRSEDGGESWSFGYEGHTFNTMYSVVADPASHRLYAGVSSVHDLYQSAYLRDDRIDGGKGAVLVSDDAGRHWRPLGDIGRPVAFVALRGERGGGTPARLYASVVNSREGGIYVCDEPIGKRAAFRKLPPPPRTQGHPYNIRILKDGSIVATYSGRRQGNDFTPSSGVFVSGDGGQTWSDRSDPRMRFWTKDLVVDPNDPQENTWYACVFHAWGSAGKEGKSGLYRTADRGENWELLIDSSSAPSGVLNVESCAFDPAHPGEFYFTTEADGLWFSPDIRAAKPRFEQVGSYPFAHPLRIQFNPYRPEEMWVTSFGNGIRVGVTR